MQIGPMVGNLFGVNTNKISPVVFDILYYPLGQFNVSMLMYFSFHSLTEAGVTGRGRFESIILFAENRGKGHEPRDIGDL